MAQLVKSPPLIPELGRSPGEGNLENSMDCIVYGVAESDTAERLSIRMYGNYTYLEFSLLQNTNYYLFKYKNLINILWMFSSLSISKQES